VTLHAPVSHSREQAPPLQVPVHFALWMHLNPQLAPAQVTVHVALWLHSMEHVEPDAHWMVQSLVCEQSNLQILPDEQV
jgi:hypothetical protein